MKRFLSIFLTLLLLLSSLSTITLQAGIKSTSIFLRSVKSLEEEFANLQHVHVHFSEDEVTYIDSDGIKRTSLYVPMKPLGSSDKAFKSPDFGRSVDDPSYKGNNVDFFLIDGVEHLVRTQEQLDGNVPAGPDTWQVEPYEEGGDNNNKNTETQGGSINYRLVFMLPSLEVEVSTDHLGYGKSENDGDGSYSPSEEVNMVFRTTDDRYKITKIVHDGYGVIFLADEETITHEFSMAFILQGVSYNPEEPPFTFVQNEHFTVITEPILYTVEVIVMKYGTTDLAPGTASAYLEDDFMTANTPIPEGITKKAGFRKGDSVSITDIHGNGSYVIREIKYNNQPEDPGTGPTVAIDNIQEDKIVIIYTEFQPSDLVLAKIGIDKTAVDINGVEPDSWYVGDFVYYKFNVVNLGEVEIFDIFVEDELLGLSAPLANLDVGERHEWTESVGFEITSLDDLVNVVTVTGAAIRYENEKEEVDASDEYLIDPMEKPIPKASIEITKTAVTGDGSTTPKSTWHEGERVWYRFVVYNSSDIDYDEVVIFDDDIGYEESIGPLGAMVRSDSYYGYYDVPTTGVLSRTFLNEVLVTAYSYIDEESNDDIPIKEELVSNIAEMEIDIVRKLEEQTVTTGNRRDPNPLKYTLELVTDEGVDFVLYSDGIFTFDPGDIVTVTYDLKNNYELVGFSSDSDDEDIVNNTILMDGNKVLKLSSRDIATFQPLTIPQQPPVIPETTIEPDIILPPPIIPQELPATSGIPMPLFVYYGGLISGFGLIIRNKLK